MALSDKQGLSSQASWILVACVCAAVAESASVTFLVSPDTHFTQAAGVLDIAKNVRGVLDMNSLPGTAYPNSTWKGQVEQNIRGVVVPGDLVDDGCNMKPTGNDPGCVDQWSNYTSIFKVAPDTTNAPTGCAYPVFEGVGNHDGGNSTDPEHGLVRRGVISRNELRANISSGAFASAINYSLSDNHMHYSWEWGGVHLAMLGVYPGDEGDCASGTGLPGTGCAAGAGAPWSWHSPEQSLPFLQQDLAKVDKATPVVVFMHYGIKGFGSPGTVPWSGYSPDFWWSQREALAFAKVLAGYNIVAIIHGHTHACVFYQWDLSNVTGHVYDVYNAPALQKGGAKDPLTTPSQYLVFEVDADVGRLRAFQRVGGAWGTIQHEKNITATSSSGSSALALTSELQPAAVGKIRVRAAGDTVVPHTTVV